MCTLASKSTSIMSTPSSIHCLCNIYSVTTSSFSAWERNAHVRYCLCVDKLEIWLLCTTCWNVVIGWKPVVILNTQEFMIISLTGSVSWFLYVGGWFTGWGSLECHQRNISGHWKTIVIVCVFCFRVCVQLLTRVSLPVGHVTTLHFLWLNHIFCFIYLFVFCFFVS